MRTLKTSSWPRVCAALTLGPQAANKIRQPQTYRESMQGQPRGRRSEFRRLYNRNFDPTPNATRCRLCTRTIASDQTPEERCSLALGQHEGGHAGLT